MYMHGKTELLVYPLGSHLDGGSDRYQSTSARKFSYVRRQNDARTVRPMGARLE
jgi:hypothetical protein